jgi:hypothetical protein
MDPNLINLINSENEKYKEKLEEIYTNDLEEQDFKTFDF